MGLFDDIRFGLRSLSKTPGLTLVAVIALALGIGANATVFSLVNAVLYKNLPFDNSDRILYITSTSRSKGEATGAVSYPDYRDLRAEAKSFEELGASSATPVNLSDQSSLPERYHCSQMTVNGFSLIRQKPVLGRDFMEADGRAGAPPVAILSDRVWESRYGRDAAVSGRTIRVNEVPTVVIGIMPGGIQFPEEADLWIPLIPTVERDQRGMRDLLVFGRISERATLASARAEISTIAERLAAEYPITNRNIGAQVQNFNDYHMGGEGFLKLVFLALMGAVGFVLLIACANVANMQLARAVIRTREISVRVALGAGRWRVIRQLIVESVMLAIASGLLGWLLGIWGARAFDAAVAGTGKPAFIDFSMDYRVFAYLAAITIATGVLFGLVPALRLSKLDVQTALRSGGRGSSASVRTKYLSGILVVTEMALAVVLLAGAGLMIRSFLNLYRANLGVNTASVLSMRISLPEAKYSRHDDQISFFQRLTARIQTLPGVESAAITSYLPLEGATAFRFEVEGAALPDPRARPSVGALVIDANYFLAMQAPPVLGRGFTETDGARGVPVVMVNRQFAKKFLAGNDPLGKRLRLVKSDMPQRWLTVVGVAPDIEQNRISRTERSPLIYLPYGQEAGQDMAVVARTRVPPATHGEAFRREVQMLDRDLPVFSLRTMDQGLSIQNWPYRVFGGLFTVFAGIALFLASIGLYAVTANSVNQRTQEIGVRVAMGATSANVMGLVFAQGMRQMALGLGVGLVAALAVTRILAGILVGISPADPVTFVTISLVLITAAMLGSAIPAWRAMRVDPIVALRHD